MAVKKDFCCMVLCGHGRGQSEGEHLCQHLNDNGMDAVFVKLCGDKTVKLSRKYWIHVFRMRYLALRKEYRKIVVIGISIGGMMQMHLTDRKPDALVFINSPTADSSIPEIRRVFRKDVQPQFKGLYALAGCYQLWRFFHDTKKQPLECLTCPTLILQSRDDTVSDPENAETLYRMLKGEETYLHYYDRGGHDMLDSSVEMAVCSRVFQFCTEIRAEP